ncbi:glycosyltransferase [Georgenia deserti]|uniref:Glycosyltransferase n=1 Tax=Georgenia deserti TaxID=2093781 RepID=A0ABW4L5X9_9MICO
MAGMPSHVKSDFFSWRKALFRTYDVLHVHWPERFYRHHSMAGTIVKRILFAVILVRLRVSGGVVVQTVHNPEPHEAGDVGERVLNRLMRLATRGWIRLNEWTPVGARSNVATIPHGHYRDLYTTENDVKPRRGALLFFGRIRPYKGVEELISALGGVRREGVTLRIAGLPLSSSYGAEIARRAQGSPSIELDLRRLSDDELAKYVRDAQLVVLPYREMHNSGALLLSLSLGRPVLVPSNDVTREFANEVGHSWVLLYDDELSADDLERALAESEAAGTRGRPDLSRRDWGPIASATADVYGKALGLLAGDGVKLQERRPTAQLGVRTDGGRAEDTGGVE